MNTGTLNVRVLGGWPVPRSFGGRFIVICAILRQLTLAVVLLLQIASGRTQAYDVFFVDQLSAAVPLLRLFGRTRVVFFCHFPDQLLAPKRPGLARTLYRIPADALEAATTGAADRLLVNSEFTGRVFAETFPRLRSRSPKVVYPGIDVSGFVAKGSKPPCVD